MSLYDVCTCFMLLFCMYTVMYVILPPFPQNFIIQHNQQYVIELDANLAPRDLFRVCNLTLRQVVSAQLSIAVSVIVLKRAS